MQIRWFFFLAAVLAITVTAVAQPTTQKSPAGSAEPSAKEMSAIVALEQRDAAAAKVNDVETLVSLWTEDGVLLQPRSEPVTGIAAIRQLLEQQKQQSAAIQTLSYLENWQERRVLGDDAYEWGDMSITAKMPDGKEMTQTVYAIRILRRQPDGSWKVARAIITPGPRKN
jgi:uncharacterized protein (TIGR02246 family)